MRTPGELYVPAFFARRHDESYRSARKMLGFLLRLYTPRSIIDFGCGTGAWLRAAADLGVEQVTGIDGDWIDRRNFERSTVHFIPMSLDKPVLLDQKYDMAISLEVIEHLPPERGEGFVEDLCRVTDIVVFSGAIPDQGGINHVNERWQSHWIGVFKRQGFECHDIFRTKFWYDKEIAPWYRQNTFLFVRNGCRERIKLPLVKSGLVSDIVHPDIYQSAPRADHIAGRDILKALPHVLTRQWRKLVAR